MSMCQRTWLWTTVLVVIFYVYSDLCLPAHHLNCLFLHSGQAISRRGKFHCGRKGQKLNKNVNDAASSSLKKPWSRKKLFFLFDLNRKLIDWKLKKTQVIDDLATKSRSGFTGLVLPKKWFSKFGLSSKLCRRYVSLSTFQRRTNQEFVPRCLSREPFSY